VLATKTGKAIENNELWYELDWLPIIHV
jgi:hypothetical protein